MLFDSASTSATDTTINLMQSLVSQLANIKFEGVLMYAILLVAAGFICMEGYGIYRAALSVIGFAVGYTQVHNIISGFEMNDQTMFSDPRIDSVMINVLTRTVITAALGAPSWNSRKPRNASSGGRRAKAGGRRWSW